MGKKTIIEELDVGTPNENGADADGIIVDFEVPTTKEVCGYCEGEGTIVNPNIGAITSEEWDNDWDEDSRDGYLNGRYDVTCPECRGANVVAVPNLDAIRNPVVRKAVEDRLDADARYEKQRRYEEKYGY